MEYQRLALCIVVLKGWCEIWHILDPSALILDLFFNLMQVAGFEVESFKTLLQVGYSKEYLVYEIAWNQQILSEVLLYVPLS